MLFLLACGAPDSPSVAPPQEGLAPAGGPAAPVAGSPPPPQPGPVAVKAGEIRVTTVGELKVALDGGRVPVLVDVRTPAEFGEGHVPGAKNIPLDQVEARAAEIGPPGEVWLICRSGGRSAHASTLLAAKGYLPVNVEGGTSAWTGAGYAVEP